MNITISVKTSGGRTRPKLECLIRCVDQWQAFNRDLEPGWREKWPDGGPLLLAEQPVVHAWIQECLADFIATQLVV